MTDSPVRLRREPPPLRSVAVSNVHARSPRMMRVVLAGTQLDGLEISEPAASVRLLVPWPEEPFEIPTWNGNEFLLADGRRPALRTFTPVALNDHGLTLDIVRHGGGAIADWAETVAPGEPCAISGPGRGEAIEPSAEHYVLLGDETAIPAIEQLLGVIAHGVRVDVHIELVDDCARLDLPSHPRATVTWHVKTPVDAPGATLRRAAEATDIDEMTRVWAAGEAAAMQAIRKHLFDDRKIPRGHTTVRGYWKVQR